LCGLLQVSRSGYYAAQKRARRAIGTCLVTTHLRAAFAASGGSYGSRRLRADLCKQGVKVGRHRIRKLMRINSISPVWKRKFIRTTDSAHTLPIADNVLDRQFKPAASNLAWVAD